MGTGTQRMSSPPGGGHGHGTRTRVRSGCPYQVLGQLSLLKFLGALVLNVPQSPCEVLGMFFDGHEASLKGEGFGSMLSKGGSHDYRGVHNVVASGLHRCNQGGCMGKGISSLDFLRALGIGGLAMKDSAEFVLYIYASRSMFFIDFSEVV